MDINKIRESMKVLKDECKKYKECKDCAFYNNSDGPTCYLEKEPASWDEEKIIENNCTTVHRDDVQIWSGPVLKCDSCGKLFMLADIALKEDRIIGTFCPYCGKKIVNYKEESE